MRGSIAAKGRGHMTDAANVMRGIILRQALYAYLRQIFQFVGLNSELWPVGVVSRGAWAVGDKAAINNLAT